MAWWYRVPEYTNKLGVYNGVVIKYTDELLITKYTNLYFYPFYFNLGTNWVKNFLYKLRSSSKLCLSNYILDQLFNSTFAHVVNNDSLVWCNQGISSKYLIRNFFCSKLIFVKCFRCTLFFWWHQSQWLDRIWSLRKSSWYKRVYFQSFCKLDNPG